MINILDKIQKINRETCVKRLKEASILKGNETNKELIKILEKCQCIQISNLINDFNKKNKSYNQPLWF